MLLVCGCARDKTERSIWRFAIEEVSGSVQDAYAQAFKERIERATQGAVRVQIYPYGTLGSSDHTTEQLVGGLIQFAISSPGHLGTIMPEVQVFLLHFLFDPDNRVNERALRDPALVQQLRQLYEEKGLAFLAAFPEGWQAWTTNRPINNPKDFSGFKMRVMTSPLLVQAYALYGASPTPLPYGEVYGALQLNMIDGQVNPIFAIEEMSFYEVTDWLILPRHAQYITTVVSNPAFLASLPARLHRLVNDTTAELGGTIFSLQADYNRDRLAIIRKKKPGLHILSLSPSERQAFQRRSVRLRQWYVAQTGKRGQRLLQAIDGALRSAKEALRALP